MQEMRVQFLGWEDFPGEANGNLLQYSCLENSMNRGTWWGTVHGVAKSQTWLNTHTHKHTHTAHHLGSPEIIPLDYTFFCILAQSDLFSPLEIPGAFNHLKSSFCTYLISGISFLFMHSYLTLPVSLWSLLREGEWILIS